jgi:hypothetical protein
MDLLYRPVRLFVCIVAFWVANRACRQGPPIHPQSSNHYSSNQSTSILTDIGRGLLALGLRRFGLDGLGFGGLGFVERRFGAGGLRERGLNIVGRARGGLRGDGRRPLRDVRLLPNTVLLNTADVVVLQADRGY